MTHPKRRGRSTRRRRPVEADDPTEDPLVWVRRIADWALEKKAEDVRILDLRDVAHFCDYFVIASGQSARQIRAIVDHIVERLQEHGRRVAKPQGYADARWIVLDLGDVVIHVFDEETREFYALEYLWRQAKIVP